jgi:hypothetical protein
MRIESTPVSLRSRIGVVLSGSRPAMAIELLVIASFQAMQAWGPLPTATIPLLLLGWLSLRLRGSGWRKIGMARPAGWGRTILLGMGAGVVLNVVDVVVVLPLLQRVTGQGLELGQFEGIQGNPVVLLIWLAIAWSLAAFGEEMAYRGYVLNRLGDLLGRGRAGQALSLVLMAVLFALGHGYQGVTGAVDNVLWALVYGALYLVSGGNLWLPIIAHGVENTVSFILLYLGWGF